MFTWLWNYFFYVEQYLTLPRCRARYRRVTVLPYYRSLWLLFSLHVIIHWWHGQKERTLQLFEGFHIRNRHVGLCFEILMVVLRINTMLRLLKNRIKGSRSIGWISKTSNLSTANVKKIAKESCIGTSWAIWFQNLNWDILLTRKFSLVRLLFRIWRSFRTESVQLPDDHSTIDVINSISIQNKYDQWLKAWEKFLQKLWV